MQIRQAKASDLPAIYQLVVELAVYEKEPDAVTATLADYERDFAEGFFQAIVAEDAQTGHIAGMALYYMTYSTWKGRMLYLEDFVVGQAFRRQGLGQRLFDVILERGRERGCKLVRWQVLDWNTPAVDFYKKNEAIIEDYWWTCKIFV